MQGEEQGVCAEVGKGRIGLDGWLSNPFALLERGYVDYLIWYNSTTRSAYLLSSIGTRTYYKPKGFSGLCYPFTGLQRAFYNADASSWDVTQLIPAPRSLKHDGKISKP